MVTPQGDGTNFPSTHNTNPYNPLFDPKTDNLPIDEKVLRNVINDPKIDPTGVSEEDRAFLNHLINLVESGKIQLMQPSSLLNEAVYEHLPEEHKGKADMEAFNMLALIRQICDLHRLGHTETFQIQNLAHRVREQNERLEDAGGDLFII